MFYEPFYYKNAACVSVFCKLFATREEKSLSTDFLKF